MTRPTNKFTRIADECGLTIQPDCEVTWKEIEFFAEQIVDECIRVLAQTNTNSGTNSHDEVVDETIELGISNIKEHFGWTK